MDSDNMSGGIVPGMIAGYFFLAFFGAAIVPLTVDEGSDSMVRH